VQRKFIEGLPETRSEVDGRLFAIDITDRLINERGEYRGWEDELHRPWKDSRESVAASGVWHLLGLVAASF
jgi:hypothetical protein